MPRGCFLAKAVGHKRSALLGVQITAAVKKHCGLRLTPHQFRHAAGTLILNKQPGNYELARRVLGHRSMRTTVQAYCGLETTQATAIFGDIVREKLRDQFSREPRLMLRALPLRDWPDEDRRIWRDALRPAQRLTAGGRAAHLRPSSKAILERNYSYYLRVVSDRGALNRSAAAATHVTPEGVEAFVERAELSRNSVSVASGVEKVRLMAQMLAPERDFGWLKNVEAQLRRSARPREKFSRIVGSEELVEAGLVLMQEAREAKPESAGASEDVSQWAHHRLARRLPHPRRFLCLSDSRPLLPEDRRRLVDQACRQRDEERPA